MVCCYRYIFETVPRVLCFTYALVLPSTREKRKVVTGKEKITLFLDCRLYKMFLSSGFGRLIFCERILCEGTADEKDVLVHECVNKVSSSHDLGSVSSMS